MVPQPVFPLELEREIFEIAALSDSSTLPSLLRVARRVLEWIEPLLYRVVVLDGSARAQACHRVLELKPTVLAIGVQHLFLNGSPKWEEEDVHSLLRLCAPQLLSLAVVAPLQQPALIPILLHMVQLRRWVGSLKSLFGSYSAIDLSLPCFRTVTHMDIFDDITDDSEGVLCAALTALPCLTHLCLNGDTLDLVPRLLVQCAQIQVVVSMHIGINRARDIAANPPTADTRFVVSRTAEEFIAGKRRGEIEASCNLLEHLILRDLHNSGNDSVTRCLGRREGYIIATLSTNARFKPGPTITVLD
ncbi:Zn(2)-C6 fungal-type domain-containing protein [Mycena sanguinolenta]|uniref:Zn(2)-C6 fungal-type domain-containing protein n=1 Tax=Mycena sanguinolenta TaxID=230812 RepID=A0A8H7CBH0_9AGAR|nr:Zn(2)-C6 fungal-type domain-containing protein [Mycena sanguinolenta]